jgi:ribosomal protein L7/L12
MLFASILRICGGEGAITVTEFEEIARKTWERGASTDEVLSALRSAGASQIVCIKVLRSVRGESLASAKVIVGNSPAWSDRLEANNAVRDALLQELKSLARDDESMEVRVSDMTPGMSSVLTSSKPPEVENFITDLVRQDFQAHEIWIDNVYFGNTRQSFTRGAAEVRLIKDRGFWMTDIGSRGRSRFLSPKEWCERLQLQGVSEGANNDFTITLSIIDAVQEELERCRSLRRRFMAAIFPGRFGVADR